MYISSIHEWIGTNGGSRRKKRLFCPIEILFLGLFCPDYSGELAGSVKDGDWPPSPRKCWNFILILDQRLKIRSLFLPKLGRKLQFDKKNCSLAKNFMA